MLMEIDQMPELNGGAACIIWLRMEEEWEHEMRENGIGGKEMGAVGCFFGCAEEG